MVTDIEMGAMEGLKWRCEERLAKDILETATDMLGALDTDTYYSASDEEKSEFLQQYADEINDTIKDTVMNDRLPKKKVGDWEIIASFAYGDKEIFIGENPSPKIDDERYIIGDIVSNELFERCENCLCSDSYGELAELYAQRMQEQIEKVKAEVAKFPYDRTIIRADSCDSIRDKDIKGEIVVIDPKAIKREYVGADRQLWIAEHGNGCSAEARGRKVYCKNVFTGDKAVWLRQDILGTIKPECIPEWVKGRMTDKPIEVLFTFGSSEKFPFQWGYVSITAPSVHEALAEFKRNWPDRTEGILNCADYYYIEDDVAHIKETKNGGKCHKSIDITIPQKSFETLLENAEARSCKNVQGGKDIANEVDKLL